MNDNVVEIVLELALAVHNLLNMILNDLNTHLLEISLDQLVNLLLQLLLSLLELLNGFLPLLPFDIFTINLFIIVPNNSVIVLI